jgi:membrane-associated phospholipid phosphatase
MTSDVLFPFLLWSLAFNYLVLLVWFFAFVFARHWIFRLHGRWFPLSETTFTALHYGGMAVYKIGILLFNLAPLVALYLMRSGC